VVLGVTVTVAVAGGLDPLLAVHVKGPAPLEVNTALCPKQIVDRDGVMAIVGDVVIVTEATAEVVQLPVPDITVYVVVVDGLTVTVPAAGGAAPLLASHENGPVPLAVNTAL